MQPLTKTETIAARLFALLSQMLKGDNGIPAGYHPIILNLVKGFLKRTDETELRRLIEQLRDEVIPWILG